MSTQKSTPASASAGATGFLPRDQAQQAAIARAACRHAAGMLARAATAEDPAEVARIAYHALSYTAGSLVEQPTILTRLRRLRRHYPAVDLVIALGQEQVGRASGHSVASAGILTDRASEAAMNERVAAILAPQPTRQAARASNTEAPLDDLLAAVMKLGQLPDAIQRAEGVAQQARTPQERETGEWMVALMRWWRDPRPIGEKGMEFPRHPQARVPAAGAAAHPDFMAEPDTIALALALGQPTPDQPAGEGAEARQEPATAEKGQAPT